MLSRINLRTQELFSGELASIYPRKVPEKQSHKIYRDTLKAGCTQSGNKVTVLELGCGTGRYFAYLHNINRLVGVDISPDMLRIAREEVHARAELVPVTSLVESSIEQYNSTEKFDFIYSIGTLGEFCVFNKEVLDKMLDSLKPGGFLFFTIVDADSFRRQQHPWHRRFVNALLKPILPYKYRVKLSSQQLILSDWKNLFMTRKEVEQVIQSAALPVKYELSLSKDNVHVHHICKVWLMNKIRVLTTFVYCSAESMAECFLPELLVA